ncbi:hypothetical protein HDU79_010429 [Rhizoclosmatium sp. JEL0117]|nr:hypothetical protein HDU79_010429 [Rhizoclosmatium sp. JEL0117]
MASSPASGPHSDCQLLSAILPNVAIQSGSLFACCRSPAVTCDRDGFITNLDFSNIGLTGRMPDFSSLTQLHHLDLRSNNLTGSVGPLPSSLTILLLDNNKLTGSLPSLPPNLRTFSAPNNGLTDPFPSPLPPSLANLILTNNEISGVIPFDAESLIHFDLNGNCFKNHETFSVTNSLYCSDDCLPLNQVWSWIPQAKCCDPSLDVGVTCNGPHVVKINYTSLLSSETRFVPQINEVTPPAAPALIAVGDSETPIPDESVKNITESSTSSLSAVTWTLDDLKTNFIFNSALISAWLMDVGSLVPNIVSDTFSGHTPTLEFLDSSDGFEVLWSTAAILAIFTGAGSLLTAVAYVHSRQEVTQVNLKSSISSKFESTRLPTDITPTKYDLKITADPGETGFAGSVFIDLQSIGPATNRITLHAADLCFTKSNVSVWNVIADHLDSVSTNLDEPTKEPHYPALNQHHHVHSSSYYISNDGVPLRPSSILRDDKAMTVTFIFPVALTPLDPTRPISLRINYTGEIGLKTMTGFFKSPINNHHDLNKKPSYIAATHFEPVAARKAFPCFDEPQFKALWTISIAAPREYMVVSNNPVEKVTELANGWTVWKFSDGEVQMSSYLVAWGIGKMKAIEQNALVGVDKKSVTVRGFVYEGMSVDDVKFSVDVATKSLKYYEKMLNTPYPMAKLDLWPMPDFAGEGMENMGLCIFNEGGLFVKTAKASQKNEAIVVSDPDHQIYVSNLVAHEVAHHWFGDLVTMKWWNTLWLNEGFAEWAQYLGTNVSHPPWRIYDRFFEMEHELVFQKELGGYTRSVGTAIEEDVERVGEITRMFDELTYNKGAAIIRMFEAHLALTEIDKHHSDTRSISSSIDFTCSPWDRVLRRYLKSSTLGTVLPNDLYGAINTEDETGFVSIAFQRWIEKEGVPVLWVDSAGKVHQERLLAWKSAEESHGTAEPWLIPFVYTHIEYNWRCSKWEVGLFGRKWVGDESDNVLDLQQSVDGNKVAMLANPGRTGLYRFKPADAEFPILAAILKYNHNLIIPIDRAGLVSDLIALTLANYIHPSQSLPVLKYLALERHPTVWKVAIEGLTTLLKTMELHGGYIPLMHFVQSLVFPVADSIGWWASIHASKQMQQPDFFTQQLRSIILPFAANLNHAPTVAMARETFALWSRESKGKSPVTVMFHIQEDLPLLLGIVYGQAIRDDPIHAWEVLRNASRLMPGDFNGIRRDVFARSIMASHLKELVRFNGIPLGTTSSELPLVIRGWLTRLMHIVEFGNQNAVEFAWESLRWGRFLGIDKEDGVVSGKYMFWNSVLKTDIKKLDAVVEAIVGAGWKDGPIWRDAVDLVADGCEGNTFVLKAVKRGLERAEAAGKFRDELGDSLHDWLLMKGNGTS